ncbi:ribosome hibernation-promoting factor, HPF/YfiA family [Methylobrevis pamukkalensis]|uniref:Ribosome hibernation promoting factor n=1 Tax=Methylobrevis pamukkalensis TaxID=1439726 RepID=A0A1E3GZ59_9HYPH|nr:ribosome-associated translation inhibitor RaiA [Methylobrevis pamukkalensis]ODN69369.1 putative sigma-54 modulation protein [Methylobrevis pamukkalensis]
MNLRITGKNVDIGQALREHIEAKISEALGKYFDGGYTGHVVVEREGSGYASDCNIHLDTGTVLQAHGRSHEVYAAADQAAERIGKRLRRYKRKLKSHHNGDDRADAIDAQAYILATPDDEDDMPDDFSPVVVAETTQRIRTSTVGMAVMELDLTGQPVLVFKNAASGVINVVYRRPDGNIGWVDPSLNELQASG